jgi:hypothetical protein
MEEHSAEVSPRTLARIGGVLYLIIIAIGLYGEAFIRERLVVSGNAAATAANLRSMEPLWRLGVAAELLLLTCAVALTLIVFVLLRPVNRDLALLATFFNLVSMALEAACSMYLLQALFPLGDASYLKAFAPAQLDALTMMAARSHGHGFGVSLIFFAWYCLINGYLIFRSGYIPKAIGVLFQVAGLCYLINSFALILSPDLAGRLYPAILVPSFVGEAALCLYLLVKGVDVERWRRRQESRREAWT